MLFVKRLVDFDGLVDLEGGVPAGVELDGALGEDTSSPLLLLILAQLSLHNIYQLGGLGRVAVHHAGRQVVRLHHVVRDEAVDGLGLI